MKKVYVTIEIVAEEDCIDGLVSDMIGDAACMDGVESVKVVEGQQDQGQDQGQDQEG